jgi:DNA invertase Pin-like site-specific DNA recombinase
MKIKHQSGIDTKSKICFSYIRYSSAGQGDKFGGTSLERQMEIAPQVATEKGWKLDETLNIQNLGLSAYHGSNKKTIEGIAEAAHQGKIPQGVICIIEALDRFTRLPLDDAYQLLRKVLLSGVEIYTNNSGRHLTKADLNNPMSLMMTAVELDAANQYSEKLSFRVKTSWRKKREKLVAGDIEKLTNKAPKWIDDKTWKIIPKYADIIRRIYSLYLAGNGSSSIVQILNAENVPTFNGGELWNTPYVGQVLKSKNVIGEFQPKRMEGYKRIPVGESIKGYYPPIIKEEIFYQVQAKYTKAFKGRIRKAHNTPNIFAGIARCTCGARMNKVTGRKTCSYLMCAAVQAGGKCNQPSIKYPPMEKSFLEVVRTNPEMFVPKKHEMVNESETIRGKILDIQKQIDNITNAVLAGSATKALTNKQNELEKQMEQLEMDLSVAKSHSTSKSSNGKELERVRNNLDTFSTDAELRNMVRDFCCSNFEKMTFNNHQRTFTIEFRNGNTTEFQLSTDLTRFKINGGMIRLVNATTSTADDAGKSNGFLNKMITKKVFTQIKPFAK